MYNKEQIIKLEHACVLKALDEYILRFSINNKFVRVSEEKLLESLGDTLNHQLQGKYKILNVLMEPQEYQLLLGILLDLYLKEAYKKGYIEEEPITFNFNSEDNNDTEEKQE